MRGGLSTPKKAPSKFWLGLVARGKPQNKFWFAVATLGWLLWEYLSNPRKRSPHYKIHGEWRVQLLKRRALRLWQSGRIWRWLWRQRWLWLLLAAALSVSLICYLATDWVDMKALRSALDLLRNNLSGGNTGAWNLFAVLVGAPIAFAIWYFRDQNNLWQIENERKDINLKDFQKLAEWASGMHLVEDKVTYETETTNSQPTEKIKTRESSQPPAHALLGTPSRRNGSASLQIAAVVQLQAFLNGEFGEQFQKPAFTLLSSIWLALVRPHWDAGQEIKQYSTRYYAWSKEWKKIKNTPLAQAITRALLDHHSQALRQHPESLPGLLLTGMNTRLPGLDPLELDGFNLQGIQLQGADLSEAQLQGAYLSKAQLQGADLRKAQLQGADLGAAQLEGADLSKAQLQGANLVRAQLEGANLTGAQLQGVNLKATDLNGAELEGACLTCPLLDNDTQWKGAQTDEDTLVEIRTFEETPLPLLTHALRLKLRKQGLVLPDFRYTEFEAAWDTATPAQQDTAYAQAGTQTEYQNDPI
jgi:uncharacterized protein YjbI with pentapeptide repeats